MASDINYGRNNAMHSKFGGRLSGFTLVEIAIVLVIVGLLLGGLFKGRELITMARVHKITGQIQAVQAAYYAFAELHRYPPGDMPNAKAVAGIGSAISSGALYGGDGDGGLDEGSFQEASAVWHHMAAAGLIQGAYAGGVSAASAYKPGEAAPANPYGGAMLLGVLNEYMDAVASPSARLALVLGDGIPVGVLRMIDNRLDDGKPATGSLRASSTAAIGSGHYDGVEQADEVCVTGTGSTAEWKAPGAAVNCNAVFLF